MKLTPGIKCEKFSGAIISQKTPNIPSNFNPNERLFKLNSPGSSFVGITLTINVCVWDWALVAAVAIKI